MIKRLLAGILYVLVPAIAAAQQPADSTTRLNAYLDCEAFEACDFDFFRTEITFVNWVRDRQVADLHLLVTTQQTGAGGREFTVTFLGLRRFAGVTDTLRYVAPPAASPDDQRRGLARTFRLGLVRYLARTPAASRITVAIADTGAGASQSTSKHDPWNYWVFSASLQSFLQGEKTFKSINAWSSLEANRVTEHAKTQLSFNDQYNQSDFEIDSANTFTNIQRGYGASLLQVAALGQHWSAGARTSMSSSTFNNYRRVLRFTPALEYDVFPYAQSTRRQLRLEYDVGYQHFLYNDTTIFDRTREGKIVHRLLTSVATREPWGSIDVGVNAQSYLDDHTKYRLESFTELSLRLFRGFSLRMFGSYSVIRDQFNLAKKDFTPEEILTRQFQRGTTYRYFGNVGLSYTFGSIYNNVVNPRMTGGFFD